MLTSGKNKSIYLHVPFCKKKCPYCHFYSIYPGKNDIYAYADAILKEIDLYQINKDEIVSIYFGGGTPSILDKNCLEKILKKIDRYDVEIAIEANPNHITLDKALMLRDIGVNRISLGVQSFNNKELKILGREHDEKTALNAIDLLYSKGPTNQNISIDLMYDIPYQTMQSFEKSLKKASNAPITHLSLYNLTIEKNTPFYKKRDSLSQAIPKEELSYKLLNYAKNLLADNNFKRYEISAFARSIDNKVNYESFHNIGYWVGREFYGFGPSAFSYIDGRRYQNSFNFSKYIEKISNNQKPIDFSEKLPFQAHIKELFVINLRMIDGVDLSYFTKKNGKLPQEFLIAVDQLINEGLLTKEDERIKLTEKGLLFYDYIASNLI